MTFSDALQPGSVPWPLPSDNPQDFPTDFASETWPGVWPKLVHSYADTAERDVELAGLSTTDRAFAFVEDSKTLWRWTGSAWALASPWVQGGTVTFGAVPAGAGISDITVNFPSTFPSAGGYIPDLRTSFQAARVSVSIVARSAGSMQLRLENFTDTASSAGATLYWSATYLP